jgi:PAS domain S-box-containing protein
MSARPTDPGQPQAPADVFAQAFHNSPAMQTVTRTSDRVLIEVNETFLRTLGFTRAEVIGRTTGELNVWVSAEKITAFRAELDAHGKIRDFETELRTKSGEIITVLLSADSVQIGGEPHIIAAGVNITGRQRAQTELRATLERLRQSEERFSKAFRSNPAMVVLTRLTDGQFMAVNEAFTRASGYAEAELLGRTAPDIALHAVPAQRTVFLKYIAEQGFMRDFELVIRTKSGEFRTLLASGERADIDGVPHVLTVGLDITERKRTEERLRESERRLRESEARFSQAFHANPSTVALTRFDNGRFVSVNEAFLAKTGYTEAEVIGRTGNELNLHAAAGQRDEYYRQITQLGRARDVELIVRAKDGQLRTILASGERCDIDGVPHVLTVGVDITERTAAEARLRENEQLLRDSEAQVRALYDGISTAVLVQDENGFLMANQAAMDLMGVKGPEEFVGKRPPDFSAPIQAGGESSAVASQRHLARALDEGRAEFEWICRRLDGSLVPVAVTLTPLQLGGRTVLQSVVLDLTERKRAETELQKALEKERELNQLKTDFVSIVSHEFRTPLEIIMSSVDNLDRYHDRLPLEKRTDLHRMIKKSVRRMAGMMEEVLLLGRLGPGGTELKPASLDLGSLGGRVRDEMESATSHRCPIMLRCEGDLADARGDEAVLRHILTNLLSNAVKYSEPGQAVELVIRRDGLIATINIADRGCGIPGADQPRLFQAFHRGGNVRQIPGTGLGLLIVRRSVELHGGEISFESTEGYGTTWTVKLPLFTP